MSSPNTKTRKGFLPIVAIATLFLVASEARSNSGIKQQAPQQTPVTQVISLREGEVIEKAISAGESHHYELTLPAGHFVRLTIDQRGIDLVEVITAPDGQKLAEVDGPSGMNGPERVFILAEHTGSYRVEVRPLIKQTTPGRYILRIQESRQATQEDKDLFAAQKAFFDGVQASRESTAESRHRTLAKFNEALDYWRALTDRPGEAQALHAIGRIYGMSGESEKALIFLNQALTRWRELGERQAEASALNNIGLSYTALGDYQKVVDNLGASLSLYRLTGDRRGEAFVNNNLCLSYRRLGDYQKALTHCNESLIMQRAMGDRRSESENLNNLGLVHKSLEEYEKAREFFIQSLALKRALGDRRGEVSPLANLGQIYLLTGDIQKALDYHNQSLELSRTLADRRVESVTLDNIGSVHAAAGDHRTALEYFHQALTLRREITDRPGEAVLLYSTARSNRELGNLAEAQTQVEASLAIIDSLRAGVINQELRDSYFASVQDVYEFHVDLLLRIHRKDATKGFDALALQANERARARGLLEMLTESNVDLRQGVEPSLLDRERSLQRLINIKADGQVRLLSGKPTAERIAAVAKEIETLTAEYAQVGAQVRSQSPRYAALTQPPQFSVKEIQEQIVDSDTMLMEYALGKERSFLWAVTRSSIAVFELPDRAKIEQIAERAIGLLRVSHKRQQKRESELANRELSNLLLGPAADRFKHKRLLIVPDGILNYVPFSALPKPLVTSEIGPDKPLIVDHDIVVLPSASVLMVLRRELAQRKPANKMIAVLADPVLESGDPRVELNKNRSNGPITAGSVEAHNDEALRGLAASGFTSFARLLYSRREAESIVTLSGKTDVLKALDFDASRATATSPELANFRIVHFATHGVVNNRHPALSGVVLSLVDRQGRPLDGFLRLHDIYNLKLGSELVVLSACQTALGKNMRGEGMVGLVRGFMYAGAPRVVATLWDVKDDATAELMKRFYKNMLVEKQSPASALRAAQLSMSRETRWNAPYYWAGFVIQGEFK
jgi:CHAT domain-containing protein/Flp pilus assembly protein TadD